MSTRIRQIALDRLVAHPDNPSRMSRASFEKLVRNIERTGRYEPLVVRPCPGRRCFFQIINGHHRCEALRRLGHRTAEVIVWTVDDEQTDILLATLNRLNGRDTLDKKVALLRRLNSRIPTRKLARLLPQTLGQIERLTSARPLPQSLRKKAELFATPMVFFVDAGQQQRIEEAISAALGEGASQRPDAQRPSGPRAGKRAAALARIAACFLGVPLTDEHGREPTKASVRIR
jgi:hypothetical protein